MTYSKVDRKDQKNALREAAFEKRLEIALRERADLREEIES
jgi:hypothetical protein